MGVQIRGRWWNPAAFQRWGGSFVDQKTFRNRWEFRSWLQENALSDKGIWLVFDKQKPPSTLTAGEALEEALCFGWIDGQMQRIDDTTYRKYFKQRGKNSRWSEKNKSLADRLEKRGLMTGYGRSKISEAKRAGTWDTIERHVLTEAQMKQFEAMLKPHPVSYENFMRQTPSVRKTYASSYFFGAKTESGKKKRFDAIVERLYYNLNPMESLKKHLDQL